MKQASDPPAAEGLLDWLPWHREAGPYRARQERTALALLAGEGCPACGAAAESESRWVNYYIIQGNAEPEVHAAVLASLGPCGRHQRRLVAARGGADVFAQTATYLAREAGRRTVAGAGTAPCPTCARETWAEAHALDSIAATLSRPAVEARMAAVRGFCFPHLLAALSRHPPREAALALSQLGLSALGGAEGAALVARLCGRDEDAGQRAALLRGAALPERGPVLREWVGAVLEVDGCPSCLAEREAVRGALEWIATGPELEPFELRLCRVHLGELHALDDAAARRIAGALAAEWASALDRFFRAVASSPRSLLLRRQARRERAAALQNLLGNRACRACEVARGAGARTGLLIEAALRDRGLADAYAGAHGLCLRHLASLPAAARQGVAGETLQARLALLGWELEEAQRKRSWFARWEPVGEEVRAWRRLPGLLGGADAGFPPGAPPAAAP